MWWLNKRGLTKETLVKYTSIANSKLERRRRKTNYNIQGLVFIAFDTLANMSCLNSGNLVHISSTWTGNIPSELLYYLLCVKKLVFKLIYISLLLSKLL
jgi:hypothetical protein